MAPVPRTPPPSPPGLTPRPAVTPQTCLHPGPILRRGALGKPPALPRRISAFPPPRCLTMRFRVAASYRVPTVLQGLLGAPKTTCLWSSQPNHKAGPGDPMFQVKKLRQRKRRGIRVTSLVSGSSGRCLLLDKGHHQLSLSGNGCSQSPLQGLRCYSHRAVGHYDGCEVGRVHAPPRVTLGNPGPLRHKPASHQVPRATLSPARGSTRTGSSSREAPPAPGGSWAQTVLAHVH